MVRGAAAGAVAAAVAVASKKTPKINRMGILLIEAYPTLLTH
jgi:hypothetical protein